LITSYNPEAGSISYAYDLDGNLSSKTDARGITVSYSYDQINRLFAKNYSSSDPSACMQYDNAASGGSDPYPIGHMNLEWTAPAGTCPTTSTSLSLPPTTAYNSTSL
jgi:YD repeat-containing protein